MDMTPSKVDMNAVRRDAWLAERRKHVTATDVAAIMGLSKWTSPMQVWLDKKGLLDTKEETGPMRWGNRLQRPILDAYGERHGVLVHHSDPYHLQLAEGFPLLGASLDAIATPSLELRGYPVDAKNIRQRGTDWGEAGGDDFPIYYQLQLVAQMIVFPAPFADLAVLFGGQEDVDYRLHFDQDVADLVKERVAVWWERHVVGDTPPEVDGSEGLTEHLKKRFAKHSELLLPQTDEAREAARLYKLHSEEEKTAKELKAKQANILRNIIGDAAGIHGLCTWKATATKEQRITNFEAVAREMAAELPAERTAEILAKHTTTTTTGGVRTLRVS